MNLYGWHFCNGCRTNNKFSTWFKINATEIEILPIELNNIETYLNFLHLCDNCVTGTWYGMGLINNEHTGMYPIASLPPSVSSWEQLDGKIIYSLNNKLYVDIQLDLGCSRIKIEEQEEVANILNSFQGTNLLNVAMIYTENPNDSLDPTKIFGSGYVDMSYDHVVTYCQN